jgi:hypothetical protein
MTTREQIISAAIKSGLGEEFWLSPQHPRFEEEINLLERFYAIAFEAGRLAEREETNRRPLPDNTAPYIRARSTK